MAFGTDKDIRPLLTIAIPTWNRANTLSKALDILLPQVEKYSTRIEVIVSDNASEDNTKEIVCQKIIIFKNITIHYNKNESNIDFFGNFRKCRELSTGQYIWILSDDDYVLNPTLSKVMTILETNVDYAAIYLKNNIKRTTLLTYQCAETEFIYKENYRMSLISSVIFLNNKNNDRYLFNQYSGNSFIAFILMLNAFHSSKKVMLIEGRCLDCVKDRPKGYNYFEVFVNHMQEVIEYMQNSLIISHKIINHFRTLYLIKFILPTYVLYKAEKKLHFGNFEIPPIREVERVIHGKYSDLCLYWMIFYPIIIIHDVPIKVLINVRRFIRRSLSKNILYSRKKR